MEKLKLLLLALFFGFSINSLAQKAEVSGVILDDQGVPLPAANVVESGTKNGVGTDLDGKFKITVSDKKCCTGCFFYRIRRSTCYCWWQNKFNHQISFKCY
jgi:hypothetical protein